MAYCPSLFKFEIILTLVNELQSSVYELWGEVNKLRREIIRFRAQTRGARKYVRPEIAKPKH
jgi:hypothetical protein